MAHPDHLRQTFVRYVAPFGLMAVSKQPPQLARRFVSLTWQSQLMY